MNVPCRAAAWTSSSPSGAGRPPVERELDHRHHATSSVSGANSSGQCVIAFRTGNGRRLAEPADRGLLHRQQPLVHLLARHRRAVVLELLREVVERAVADPARRALLARLLGEEAHRLREQAKWRVRHGEDLHGGRARACPVLTQAIPRERRIERGRRKDAARGAAGNDSADLVRESARVLLDELARRHAVRRLVAAGLPDRARDRPEARPLRLARSERGPPLAAVPEDGRDVRQRLDVLDQCRSPEVPDLARERRLQPRHRSPALHGLEHRGLLARDVRTGADDELERQSVEQARGAKLVERLLESRARCCVFLAEVDMTFGRIERPHCEHRRLEHEMWPELHHIAVLDRSRLALVCVHDDVARAGLARDRLPFHPGWEPSAPVPREPRRLQLFHDPLE